MVGASFQSRKEAEKYPDVSYALSVEARAMILRRRLRSVQRLLDFLHLDVDVDKIPFNLHTILEISGDAGFTRIASLSDLVLILTREVVEVGLRDIDTTFGNLTKSLPSSPLLPVLGRVCDPKKPMKLRRNERIHSGFDHGFDDLDLGFEMAALWKSRGQNMKVVNSDLSEVSLSTMFLDRRRELLSTFSEAVSELLGLIDSALYLLSYEFDERFEIKVRSEDSYMQKLETSTAPSVGRTKPIGV